MDSSTPQPQALGSTELAIVAVSASVPRADLGAAPAAPDDVAALLSRWFPGRIGSDLGSISLRDAVRNGPGQVCAGIFGETVLVCGPELAELVDLAATLGPEYLGRTVFALQVTADPAGVSFDVTQAGGEPVRELLVVHDDGVVFDDGPHFDFETALWDAGEVDPMRFGSAALRSLFGFAPGGAAQPGDVDADAVRLQRFQLRDTGLGGNPGAAVPVADTQADGQPPPHLPSSGTTARPLPAVADPDDRDRTGRAGLPAGPAGSAESAPPASGSWWSRLAHRLFG